MTYTKINSAIWDQWGQDGSRWSKPINHQTYTAAQNGDYQLYLTPDKPVPHDWLGDIKGQSTLGLASGGGQQGPLLSALGGHVTIFDYSDHQLDLERTVAEQEHYQITLVKGDMTQPLPFADQSFDLIVNPVSNSYVEDLYPIYRECARILKPGGKIILGFANPEIYLFNESAPSIADLRVIQSIPYNPLQQLTPAEQKTRFKDEGVQFSHTWEAQLRSLMQAGLHLDDCFEDTDKLGDPVLSAVMPMYFAIKASK